MHMADALVSAPVALTGAAIAATLVAFSGKEIRKNTRPDIIPLMGVTGAFIFAAQMINFSIPGTGSSGHIVGGVLLAALLGPWAGFLTLASVLIIQCLIFADGGLLALGCNIINMGAMTALIAYPLIYRPITRGHFTRLRIMAASIAACIIGLEAGAALVTLETVLSGVTALPFKSFLGFMTGIHLAIGLCEGIVTGLVILYVKEVKPSILYGYSSNNKRGEADSEATKANGHKRYNVVLITFAVLALALGGGLAFYASSDPDGLEWSIEKLTGTTELSQTATPQITASAERVQQATAVMPDYESSLSGIVGSVLVLIVVFVISSIVIKRPEQSVS